MIKGYIVEKSEKLKLQKPGCEGAHFKHVHRHLIEISYLSTDGKIKKRKANLFIPEASQTTLYPLVIAVHYELPDCAPSLYDFIENGWAVATPTDLEGENIDDIAGDDLRFNIALLSAARRWSQFGLDSGRIALVGSSAGGYQAMMLSIMHLGISSSTSFSGIYNMPYEFSFIRYNNSFNKAAEEYMEEQEKEDFCNYPIPYIKKIYDSFCRPSYSLVSDDPDSHQWLEFSPAFHLNKIMHPIVLCHSTADTIVPIYQLTEAHAYPKADDMPEGFKLHLKDFDLNPMLNKPIDEIADKDRIQIFKPDVLKEDGAGAIIFNPEKCININILDEGELGRPYAHFKDEIYANISNFDFIKHSFSRKSCETNKLNFEKLNFLAQRFHGKCELFRQENRFKQKCPAAVFGSLESDRLDVLSELCTYLGINLFDNLEENETSAQKANAKKLFDLYQDLSKELGFLIAPSITGNHCINCPEELVGALKSLTLHYVQKCEG